METNRTTYTNQKISPTFKALNELEEYINQRKTVPLLNKMTVEPSVIYSLLERIREVLPKDLQDSDTILREAKDIITHAEEQHQSIIENAQNIALARVSESRIVQDAQEKAQLILEQALVNAQAEKERHLEEISNAQAEAEHIKKEAFSLAIEIFEEAQNKLETFNKEFEHAKEIAKQQSL